VERIEDDILLPHWRTAMQLHLPEFPPEDLLVADGTAMLFRAYHSREHHTPSGEPAGGTLGMCEHLLRLVRRHNPRYIALVFDAGQRTFRNDMDESYKANRGDPPEALVPQFESSHAAAKSLGFTCLRVPGFEADDLMATLAELARAANMRCRLHALDKDLWQLIDDRAPAATVEDPRNGQVLDEAAIVDKLGVPPRDLVDYFAIVGDSSDNIPGVRGVGPKGAQTVVSRYGKLEAIHAKLGEIPHLGVRGAASLAEKLRSGRQDALHAREMIRLRRDVELGIRPQTLREATAWGGPMPEESRETFQRLGAPWLHRAMTEAFRLRES